MKQFLFAAAGLFAFATANAQNVTLNVNLRPIQTIVVTGGLGTVNLTYKTKADYDNGVSSKKENQLTIYSTGGYEVSVKSDAALMSGGKPMNVSGIQVIPTDGDNGVTTTAANYTPQYLSESVKPLVTSATGTVNKKISIEYKGAGANAYVDNYIAGQNPTVYTTILTYSIVSK